MNSVSDWTLEQMTWCVLDFSSLLTLQLKETSLKRRFNKQPDIVRYE